MSTHWTLSAIKRANRDAGGYWFDPATVRFFRSRVSETVHQGPGGVYFVSSEQGPNGVRAYTVRTFDPDTASIDTVGDFQAYRDRRAAHRAAREAAAGGSQ